MRTIAVIFLVFLISCSSEEQRFLPVTKEKKKVININFWNLRKIPESVWEYSSEVETLRLSYNRLEGVPSRIGILKELVYLDFSHNSLRRLPAEIGALSNLRELLLSHNLLTRIPEEASALRLLKHFDASYNRLEEIPNFLIGTLGLGKLNLSGNRLKKLRKPLLKNLSQLTELNLAENQLRHLFLIDSTWINPALKKLDLRKNRIQGIVFNLSYPVEEIDLSENQIFYFNVWQVLQVKKLNLSNNKLTYVRDRWQYFPNLKVLNLSGNLLSYLPKSFATLSKLDTLDLSYNKFTFIPEELLFLNNLSYLNLEGNNIPEETVERLRKKLPNTEINYERGYYIKRKNRGTNQDSLAFPLGLPQVPIYYQKDSL